MKTTLRSVLGAMVLMFAGSAFADQPDSNSLLAVKDYIEYASNHNTALVASVEEWRIAVEQIPQAKALPEPKFTYKLETQRSPHGQTFGIFQAFPWFGTLDVAGEMAAAAGHAARQRYQMQQLKVIAEVKDGFYEYSFLARQLEIARANLELLKHFEEVARIRYATSQAAQPDVIRAQIEIATVESEIKNLEQLREPVAARLNSILNRPSAALLPWPRQERFKDIELDRQQIVALLIQNNPQLHAKDFEIAAAQKGLELAKKKFYPQMEVGVEAMYQAEATMGPGSQPVYAMVSFSLPLWRESYSAAQRQAAAQIRKARDEKVQAQNELAADAAAAVYDYENSIRNLKLYRDTLLPKTRELLAASENAYSAGTADFLGLIDAQRKLLGFELTYEEAVKISRQKLARLEALVGAKIEQ